VLCCKVTTLAIWDLRQVLVFEFVNGSDNHRRRRSFRVELAYTTALPARKKGPPLLAALCVTVRTTQNFSPSVSRKCTGMRFHMITGTPSRIPGFNRQRLAWRTAASSSRS
jgi:hypothetical protein